MVIFVLYGISLIFLWYEAEYDKSDVGFFWNVYVNAFQILSKCKLVVALVTNQPILKAEHETIGKTDFQHLTQRITKRFRRGGEEWVELILIGRMACLGLVGVVLLMQHYFYQYEIYCSIPTLGVFSIMYWWLLQRDEPG